MSSHGLPLDRIDEAYLETLRADSVAEGRQLEYKEQLPADADDEAKREFLRDVASFANSIGGDLIYGVKEGRDTSNTPKGVPEAMAARMSASRRTTSFWKSARRRSNSSTCWRDRPLGPVIRHWFVAADSGVAPEATRWLAWTDSGQEP